MRATTAEPRAVIALPCMERESIRRWRESAIDSGMRCRSHYRDPKAASGVDEEEHSRTWRSNASADSAGLVGMREERRLEDWAPYARPILQTMRFASLTSWTRTSTLEAGSEHGSPTTPLRI